jgi:BlaI family penicillinase repressor
MIQISAAEAVVMEVLWGLHPLSADEVIARLPGGNEWAEATVKTLLNRLLNKGAIAAQKDGRRYLYSPLVQRDTWVLEESSSLIERLFEGRVAPLVAHFSQHRRLSRDDVAELRKLLEDLDDDQR